MKGNGLKTLFTNDLIIDFLIPGCHLVDSEIAVIQFG